MRSITLITHGDEYTDRLGLAIKGTDFSIDGMMADRDGTLIAHDLLEHQNGIANIGSVWDELEAVGGIWQVRGRHGDFLRGYTVISPVENVAADIDRMFPEWLSAHQYDGPGSPAEGTKPHIHDDDFEAIIAEARRTIPINHEHEEYTPAELDAYMALALRRMRIGFRKAERRFGPRYVGYDLFRAIQSAVRGATKEVEFEGQEFLLRYGNREATVREIPLDIND